MHLSKGHLPIGIVPIRGDSASEQHYMGLYESSESVGVWTWGVADLCSLSLGEELNEKAFDEGYKMMSDAVAARK